MLQKTLFRKGARGELALAQSSGKLVKEVAIPVTRDTKNKNWKRPSRTQIANFNNKELFRTLQGPVTAKVLGPIAHIINIPESKKKHSKWFLHCRRLEEKGLKESVGLGDRMVRSQDSMSAESGGSYEEHNARKKRAPDSRLISELKGVPEKGRLLRDESHRSVQADARKRERLADAIREVVTKEIYAGNFPAFDAGIAVGRAELAEVVMSSDKKRAYLYYVPPPLARDQLKAAKDWEERFGVAKGFLRNAVAQRIRTKLVPSLEFRLYDAEKFKQHKKQQGKADEELPVRVLDGRDESEKIVKSERTA